MLSFAVSTQTQSRMFMHFVIRYTPMFSGHEGDKRTSSDLIGALDISVKSISSDDLIKNDSLNTILHSARVVHVVAVVDR